MQTIFSTLYFQNSLIRREYNNLTQLSTFINNRIYCEYYKLHKMIWGKNCIVSPGSFLRTIQNVARQKQLSLFTGFNQNDISEFLLFVLDCFHNALRREVIMNIKGTPENNEDKMAIECYKTIKNMYSKSMFCILLPS